MKKISAFSAGILIPVMSLSMLSCGSSEETSKNNKQLDEGVRKAVNEIAGNSDLLTGDLEKKTIKWMSDWDINPDLTGKNVPIDLAVFQERYGGKVEFHYVTYETRYEKLAEAINSGEGIDFFYGGNLDAFPKGAVKEMFRPVDDYIDFDSELWKDVKELNDSAVWNDGKHYLAVTNATDNCVVIYNRKTIQEAGLDDPAELYKKGKWNWDTFQDMLNKFVDSKNQKYGIDGWFFEFGLMGTTGVPAVGLENGKLKNNLADPNMERCQNWLYELYNTDCIAIGVGDYGWDDKPEYIGEGKLLFYPCGLYTFYTTDWKEKYGEDVFFVPMPKDPKAEVYYTPTGIDSYLMVNGGQNPEGVAKYLDCKRFVLTNDKLRSYGDQQMFDDYGWNQEMFDMKEEVQSLAAKYPIIDFSKGVSTDCGSLLDSNLRNAARGTPWNETFDSIYEVVNTYLDELND